MAKKTHIENVVEEFAPMIVDAIGADVADPVQRAMLFESAQPVARRIIAAALAEARGDAVREAKQTRSVADLASDMGVTPARIYQIMDGK